MKLTDKAKSLFGLLKVEPIKTRDELLAVCATVATQQLKRDARTIERDARLQLVSDEYDGEIERLNATIKHEVGRIQSWALAHREEFGRMQSLVLAGHELAFHKGTGAVKFREGLKEEDIVQAILGLEDDELKQMVLKVVATLAKAAVLREWRLKDAGKWPVLSQLGVQVAVEESFTFTPAREALPDVAEKTTVAKEAA